MNRWPVPLLLLLLAACGAAEERPATLPTGAAQGGREVREIRLQTADGLNLEAAVCGQGEKGLVLCHGRKFITGWKSFRTELEDLAGDGLHVLALSFRGYPASAVPALPEGGVEDVLAGYRYLCGQGVKQVFLLGSSMGGWYVLEAARRLDGEAAFGGVIVVSAGEGRMAAGIAKPKLFVVASDDGYVLDGVLEVAALAEAPKRLLQLDQGGHGQLLIRAQWPRLRAEIVEFVKGSVAGGEPASVAGG